MNSNDNDNREPFIVAELREQSERVKDQKLFPIDRYQGWREFRGWLRQRAKIDLPADLTYFQDRECLRLKLICEN